MRGFVLIAIGGAIGCTSSIGIGDDFNGDAGFPDASIPETFCNTTADCPQGMTCGFPIKGGCDAPSQCFPDNGGACKGLQLCACDGTDTTACNGGASVPIRSTGFCDADAGCASITCAKCNPDYVPTLMPSPLESIGACSGDEIDAFVAACYGATSTSATCDTWGLQAQADAGTCLPCELSGVSAIAWGASVCQVNVLPCALNTGGCIDLELGQIAQEASNGGAGSCGDLYSASTACSAAYCSSCMMPSNDYDNCVAWANANDCKTYVTATENPNGPCAALYGGDASMPAGLTKCFPQDATDTIAFMNVFCGSGL